MAAIVGTSRRARLLTALTVAALAAAIVGFVALDTADDETGSEAFTEAADQICLTQRETIAALGQQIAESDQPDVAAFSGALVSIVAEWRMSMDRLHPPAAQAAAARRLDAALLDVLIEAGALAQAARTGTGAEVSAQAAKVDSASVAVNAASEELGLENCAGDSFARVANGDR